MNFDECLKQLQDNHNKLIKEKNELQNFKDEAEETCESVPVVKDMEKRIESAENGMEMLIIERELHEVIDNMGLSKLRKNKELMEYNISYKLGCKLVFDYNLVTPVVKYINGHKMVIPLIEDGEYVINENKSLGFKYWKHDNTIRLCHDRFDFDCRNDKVSIENNYNIMKLFDKYYKNFTPVIRSSNGGIFYKILRNSDIQNNKYMRNNKYMYCPKDPRVIMEYYRYDNNIWNHSVDVSGDGTRDIIYEILSNIK